MRAEPWLDEIKHDITPAISFGCDDCATRAMLRRLAFSDAAEAKEGAQNSKPVAAIPPGGQISSCNGRVAATALRRNSQDANARHKAGHDEIRSELMTGADSRGADKSTVVCARQTTVPGNDK